MFLVWGHQRPHRRFCVTLLSLTHYFPQSLCWGNATKNRNISNLSLRTNPSHKLFIPVALVLSCVKQIFANFLPGKWSYLPTIIGYQQLPTYIVFRLLHFFISVFLLKSWEQNTGWNIFANRLQVYPVSDYMRNTFHMHNLIYTVYWLIYMYCMF